MFKLSSQYLYFLTLKKSLKESCINNHLYEFLKSKNFIYDLQFGFQQKHSTCHALVHLTDKIWEQLDKGSFGCEIFVVFQKASDTVDHNILIQKLNHYGVRGTANNWFLHILKIQQVLMVTLLIFILFVEVYHRVPFWNLNYFLST